MSFAHSGMAWESLCTEQFCTDGAMTDIWFGTKALDAGCVTTENADVVEHGGFFYKWTVCIQFGVLVNNGECLVCHTATMHHENVFQFVLLGVVFIDDGLVVHR